MSNLSVPLVRRSIRALAVGLTCALVAAFLMVVGSAPAHAADQAVTPPTCTGIPNTMLADSPDGTYLGLKSEGWLSGALASDAWQRDHCVYNGTGYDPTSGAYASSGLAVSVAGTLRPGTSTITISTTDGFQTRKWRDLTDPNHPTYEVKQHILVDLAPNGGAHNDIVYGITAHPLGATLYGAQPLDLGLGTLDPGANVANCRHDVDAGGSSCTYTVTLLPGTPAFEGYISLNVLAVFVDPTSYPSQDAGEFVDDAYSPAVIPHIQVPIAYTGEAAPPVLTLSSITTDPATPLPGQPFNLDMAIRNDSATDASNVVPAPLSLSPTADLHLNTGPTPASVATLAAGATTHFTYQLTADKTEQVSVIGQASATIDGQSVSTKAQTRLINLGAGLSATLTGPANAPVKGVPFHVTATVTNGSSDAQDVVPGLLTAGSATGFTASPSTPDLVRLAGGASATFDYEATETEPGTLNLSADFAAHDVSNLVDSTVTAHGTIDVSNGKIIVNTTGDQELPAAAMADSRCDVDSTTTGDQCTLRAAIALANHRDDAESITFDIPGGGVPVIAPASALPAAATQLSIDGTTQAGGWIRLDGLAAGSSSGLVLRGANSIVRGLVVSNWAGAGLRVQGASSTIAGNRIGTSVNGLAAAPNVSGIVIEAPAVQVGGTAGTSTLDCTGDCNLISGNGTGAVNDYAGVAVCGQGSSSHIIGNWIGTDATGAAPLHNDFGVMIDSQWRGCTQAASGLASLPSAVVVGGTTTRTGAAPGNLISGNHTGVNVATGSDATIAGNLIGTDALGAVPVRNPDYETPHGVATYSNGYPVLSRATTVGGPAAGDRNVISGQSISTEPPSTTYADYSNRNTDHNAELGAGVYGAAYVRGNYIGTDITGTHAVGNDEGVVGIHSPSDGSADGSVIDNLISANLFGIRDSDNLTSRIPDGDFGRFAAITGNRIGTTADGRSALGNGFGVSTTSTVGGLRGAGNVSCDSPCNLISGNVDRAVAGGVVEGNFIGTDITGTRAIPNTNDFPASPYAAISSGTFGGPSHATSGICDLACNLISGNTNAWAILVFGSIQGNVIGRGATGLPLPNGGGVVPAEPAPVQVGGDGPGEGNLISGNTHEAILGTTINDNHSTVAISGNVITGNGGGIDYGDVGSHMDPFEYTPDRVGTNTNPLAPRLNDVSVVGNVATLRGLQPGFTTSDQHSYRIDLYASPTCERPSEGAIPIGHETFGALSAASFSMTATLPAGARVFTATVTLAGATSKFSDCLTLAGAPSAALNQTSVAPGAPVTVTADGFSPGEQIDVSLHSDPVHLATVVADGSGHATATVTIPLDTEPGLHHLVLTGLTSGVTVSIAITVTAAAVGASPVPTSTAQADTSLASTGSPIEPMLILSALLVLCGLVLRRVVRRAPR